MDFLTVQIDVIASLLSGRLVRERIGPAMLSAVQSQVLSSSGSSCLRLCLDLGFVEGKRKAKGRDKRENISFTNPFSFSFPPI